MTVSQSSRSIVQCPHCAFKTVEKRPTGRGPSHWPCPACGVQVVAPTCCVFCDFGSEGCRAPTDGR